MVVALALALSVAAPPATEAPGRVSADDLVEVAEIVGPSLSPDGRRIAYRVSRPSVADNETYLDWYVVDAAGGKPVHAGSGGAAQHDGSGALAEAQAVWDPDSGGFRFLALVDGEVAIWHWRDGGIAKREIASDADILRFEISADGTAVRYTTGATRSEVRFAEHDAYANGIVVDDRLDLNQPLAGGMIVAGRRIMQRFPSQWFDRAPILWNAPKTEHIWRADDAREEPADLLFPDPPAAQGRSIALADGRRAEIRDTNDAVTVEVVGADGRRTICRAEPCLSPRLVALAASPIPGRLLLFEADGSARERVWLWPIGAAGARLVATTDGALRAPGRRDRCLAAAAGLVCAEASPLGPPQLVRIDYRTGKRHTLDDPNAALRARIEASARILRWPDGHTGVLLRPRAYHRPLPLVIHYSYCEGFMKGGAGDEIPMIPLVESGIAVLCMDRTRPAKGAPMEASYATGLSAMERAIDDLARAGEVDPRHVGIGGLSFGSTVVIWSLRHSKKFAAATISSGQVTPHYYWSNALPDRGFAAMFGAFWSAGDPERDRERWEIISPAFDAASIDTPLLMQVPESEVRNLAEFHTKLKLAGKPAEMIAFADEVHVKYQPVHKRAVYERNLDWYRFWLAGEEDPAPAKSGQYARWRSLRAGQSLPVPAP
ncbi:Atxe2 family lasso peptide isopeptidase [Sphingopyxis terrae subsp. ummariensis]